MSFLVDAIKSSILITGGGSGIGLSLAKQFIALGHEVIAVGRTQSKLDSAKAECPKLITFTADISNEKGRNDLLQRIVNDYPQVNVLVNNAAVIRRPPPLSNVKPKDWSPLLEEININLVGLIHLSLLFLPHLNQKPKAMIVNVSSVVAFTTYASAPIYTVTKGIL